jgi:hypothetical protein
MNAAVTKYMSLGPILKLQYTEALPIPYTNSVLMQDLLGDWQQGTELDGSVYRVAATIPLNGVQFDPEGFVTRLRAERGA